MLRPRIIPFLLVEDGRLIKTVKFESSRYIGDPINAVRIFNEKEADELSILDISATVKNKNPDFNFIKRVAKYSMMPLCYGGGVKSLEDFDKIINLGVEKVSISSLYFENSNVVRKASEIYGSQSIVLTIDLKKENDDYSIYIYRKKKKIHKNLYEVIREAQELGIGEIVLNYIDRDGTYLGYDIDHIKKIYKYIKIPLTVLGGAKSLENMKEVIEKVGIIGCGAGSLFVFKGKQKAVLINYPSIEERSHLYEGR